MATSNPDRFELSVSFQGRRVNVWSDEDNVYRTIQNYFYQPLFNLESDRITVDGNLLQLDIIMWSEELENVIKHELNTIYTGHVIAVQMMPFDEVKLSWRGAPPGVEIPDHPIPFNHQPQNHVFVVRCESKEMCEIYKSRLQQSPQSIGSGLVIGASRHGNEYVFRVNTEPIIGAQTVRPDIDECHDHVKLFHDNLVNQFCQMKHTLETVEERLNQGCTEHQLVALEAKLNKTIDDAIGGTTGDVIGRIDELERSTDDLTCHMEHDVIDSLMINTQVQIDFSPVLVTSLPGGHVGRQSRVICADWGSSNIYYMDDDNVMKRYVKCNGRVIGLLNDNYGHLFVLVKKKTKFYLRKYKNRDKLIQDGINDILPHFTTLVISGDNIYIQSGRDIRVLHLLENPKNSLIDRNRVNKYQLPDGEYSHFNCFTVDSRGRMFVYCNRTNSFLFLTAEAKPISSIDIKDCGLTFDPRRGRPCIISDKHVLLSVNPGYPDCRGAVMSFRYNDQGFIDRPRIVLNSTDSVTCQIYQVRDSNTVAIRHYDDRNDRHSLRIYNINNIHALTK
ncbi:uncharacterized protein LOC141907375 [Tubulanus polymorphus]|uniref:uncharacterized protein LOC141907375 n=1 Tax=Tubulanus polymorphus TaxID=672921 RepID=UPI003DA36013